jgi:DNA polymerase-1
MSKPTLLIDGDVVAYKTSFLAEQPFHWGDDFWTLHCDLKEVVGRALVFIEELKDSLDADDVVVALSHSNNFRKSLSSTYKAHRASTRKPVVLNQLKERLKTAFKTEVWDNIEADDVIGVLATGKYKDKCVVVSIDKDFKTFPAKHYNPDKPHNGISTITNDEADYWFMYQTLVGDTTDGYPGCPGIGPKRAEGILGEPGKGKLSYYWECIKASFKKAGLGEEEAITQARLARILRHGEYDNEKKKPVLWKP